MRGLWREFGWMTLLVVLGATGSLISGRADPPWVEPEIGPGEIRLIDARALDPIWVDARSHSEIADGTAEGAVLLREDNWEGGIASLMEVWLPNPRPIVIFCSDEACGTSKRLAERLREALPDAEVYSLKGGWAAWDQ